MFKTPLFQILLRWWALVGVVTLLVAYLGRPLAQTMGWVEDEYELVLLVEIRPIFKDDLIVERGRDPKPMTRRFGNGSFGPDFQHLLAPSVLEKSLQYNNILARLGGNKKGALIQMKTMLKAGYHRHSDIVEVKARHADPVLARDLLLALCRAYQEKREELEVGVSKSNLKAIKVEIINKGKRVVEFKKKVREVEVKLSQVKQGSPVWKKLKSELILLKKEMMRYRQIRDSLQEKYDIESTKTCLPRAFLIIHQEPEIPTSPMRSWTHLLAGVMSLPIALIFGCLSGYLAERIFPR